jgi:hypothetical protein
LPTARTHGSNRSHLGGPERKRISHRFRLLAERIDVHSLNAVGLRLHKAHVGQATIADRPTVRELMQEAASAIGGHKFSQQFLLAE